ncbi:MAG TPA: HEAT repeat domain-containing protein, partial [Kofleriaceae bacterium]
MTARSFTLTPAEQQRIDHVDQLVILGGAGVPELVAMIGDPSWTVRRAAVAALISLGDEAVPALQAWLVDQRSSEHAIAAAVDVLAGSIGPAATPAALAMLHHARPEVAADGAVILGRRHAVTAAPELVAQLGHADDNVAVASIEALGSIGPTGPAVDALIAVLEQRSFFRSFPALQVLAKTGDPRTVQPIAALTEDPLFRDEAIRALGRTGSPLAVAPLTRMVSDPELVRTAVVAIADLIGRAQWSGAAPHIDAELRSAIVPATLITAMSGAAAAERAAIVTVLGHTGSTDVVPILVTFLDDEALRSAAIESL